jgi:predicted GNAT family N-acyltransferase
MLASILSRNANHITFDGRKRGRNHHWRDFPRRRRRLMHQDNPARIDPAPLPRSIANVTGEQHPSAALQVRWIAAGENLGDVHRLRRDVYFHEQGGPYSDRSKRVADGLDGSGATLAINQAASTIATLRLHDFGPSTVQVEYGSLFQIDHYAHSWPLDQVAVGTRFAVQADHRVKPVMDRLMEETYRRLLNTRMRFCLIACEPYLHDVFEYYGFREYLPPAILPGGACLLRMVLVVADAPHLLACGSPLYNLVNDADLGAAAKAWLTRTFSHAG